MINLLEDLEHLDDRLDLVIRDIHDTVEGIEDHHQRDYIYALTMGDASDRLDAARLAVDKAIEALEDLEASIEVVEGRVEALKEAEK